MFLRREDRYLLNVSCFFRSDYWLIFCPIVRDEINGLTTVTPNILLKDVGCLYIPLLGLSPVHLPIADFLFILIVTPSIDVNFFWICPRLSYTMKLIE